jgi:glyoxylase-like metal-dependent hydrolase (beta-lactamase superfamily II)
MIKQWCAAVLAACGLLAVPAGAHDSSAMHTVGRAIEALGGYRLANVRAVTIRGQNSHYEPQQSLRPDGEAVPSGTSAFTTTIDLVNSRARTEWERNLTTPTVRVYKFSEVVTPEAGYVKGIDSSGRNKQSRDSNPPQHTMSGQRLAVMLRELQRGSPHLLIAMRADPHSLKRLPDEFAAGKRLTAVEYKTEAARFVVMFDQASGLPARVRTIDTDQAWGDINFDLILSDWREVGGAKFAFHQIYTANERVVLHQTLSEVSLNPSLAKDLFEIPAQLRAGAQPPSLHDVEYQWIFRRMLAGGLFDTNELGFDPQTGGLRLEVIAPGVHHVVGGNPNNMVVEMKDHLVVFDAPNNETHTTATLAVLRAAFPRKPVKALVLTHHHMDHANGARGFGAAGAKIYVGAGNGEYIRRMMTSPHNVRKDALAKQPRAVEVIEVKDKLVLGDGTRSVELYRIANTHAEGMLIGYLPEAKLGYVTDLWAPGRDSEFGTERQRALVDAVEKAGIRPERFAGGHGGVASYVEFAGKVRGAK